MPNQLILDICVPPAESIWTHVSLRSKRVTYLTSIMTRKKDISKKDLSYLHGIYSIQSYLFLSDLVILKFKRIPTLWIYRMTSSVTCCARFVNQNKWPTLLHGRADIMTRYNRQMITELTCHRNYLYILPCDTYHFGILIVYN